MILFLLILVGLGLRLWQLGEPSYWMDESFSIATAQTLARSPLYHALLALVGASSNWQIVAIRGLSVGFGVGMVVASYSTLKRWVNVPVAIVTASLITFSTIEIAWSRQVRMYALLQLCFWLSLYCYERWRGGKMHWVFPLITTLATVFTHELGWFLLLGYIWYEVIRRGRHTLFSIITSLVVVFIVIHIVVPTLPLVNYWWHYLYYLTTNYYVLVPLALLGSWWLAKTHQRLVTWLVIVWLGWLFCISFIVPLLQYRYLFMTLPILFMLAAAGLVWLWRQHWAGKLAVGLSVGIVLWQQQLTVLPQVFYPLESDTATAPFEYKTFTPQPNFTDAYTVIKNYQSQHDDIVIATPYPIIHQLYMGTAPDHVIFVNLTGGTYPTIPATEYYSGLPYSAPEQLPADKELLIILDQFAEYRLDARWQGILGQAEVLWQDDTRPWSRLTIYRIL
ncbi:MAG: hypothetical protein HY565_03920 [Candidatus Kerfeldbacteria bacterium]|nr:hypothetical protein [Candidatus Kerfeldbacteria bacterium]